MFFFLFDSNFEVLLFDCNLANIRLVDHFDQFLYLLKVHVFQFRKKFIFERLAKIGKSGPKWPNSEQNGAKTGKTGRF
jgi:hypothetical protein